MAREFDFETLRASYFEGLRLMEEYQHSRDAGLLERADALLRLARDHGPREGRAAVTQNIGAVAMLRWEHTRQEGHLDTAVALFRDALSGSAGEPAGQLLCLQGLARALRGYARMPEIDECVAAHRRLVQVGGDRDPDRVVQLREAAEALRTRYRLTGEPADLVEASGLSARAALLLPSRDRRRAEELRLRAECLDRVCEKEPADSGPESTDEHHHRVAGSSGRSGGGAGAAGSDAVPAASGGTWADEAVAAWRDALAVHPDGSPEAHLCRSGLGHALLRRHQRQHEPEDLDEAVILLHAALLGTMLADDEAVVRVAALCDALVVRAGRNGWTGDLDNAVAALRVAARAHAHQPHETVVLKLKTTQALLAKYRMAGGQDVLDEAVTEARGALAATGENAAGPANTVVAHGLLAEALHARYELTVRPADLDEAIALLERAATLTAGANRVAVTMTLADCLLTRAGGTRHTKDVRQAVELLRTARDQAGPHGAYRATLSNRLGNALLRLFERTGDQETLSQASDAYQATLQDLSPRDPRYPLAVASLAGMLRIAHEHTGALEPLEYAVGCHRHALALCAPDHDDRRLFLDGLGYVLRKRYDATGDLADLRECVEVLREAVAGFPAQHPQQMATRYSLVQALRAEHLRTGDPERVREAAEVAAAAGLVRTAPVSRRVEALDVLGHCRATLGDWTAAADALGEAVALLPRLASRNRLRVDQHHDLAGTSGVAMSAAACALNAGRPQRALELLEQGRGVLLSRRLTARGGLGRLWAADPGLAQAYERLRREFDAPEPDRLPDPDPLTRGTFRSPDASRDREAEWEALLGRIRALPGLDDFLRPATARELLAGTGTEPVVLLTTTKYRCDALILRAGRLDVLPLPELTLEDAIHNATALGAAAAEAHDPKVRVRGRMAAQETVRQILDWLWRTTVGPVLDRLGHHGPPRRGGPWPRVTWCPTGPMAFFPLHAAGPAGDDGAGAPTAAAARTAAPGACALDRAVSSYSPTVEALIRVRSRPPAGPARTRACVVAMSSTPGGHAVLPSALPEARLAADALPGARVQADEGATRERVLAALAEVTHAHFVCHAVSDPSDPAAGRLLVHDHVDHPLTVADVSALGLDQGELAYLSACSTTRSTPRLTDEAVHITGAFLLAGFRNVIGTLWETDDQAALEIARRYYATPAPPPYALHTAVRALRDRYPRTPSLWAAHTHTGA
ncbi:CHAT domain-containing protein [Streptomyces sp. NPDC018610]|uniref:CHAT domain-containing protein n=1 Tax=Streptomyces sp. NPDC018610 TaxID=3365049 RepID=UPI00378A314D